MDNFDQFQKQKVLRRLLLEKIHYVYSGVFDHQNKLRDSLRHALEEEIHIYNKKTVTLFTTAIRHTPAYEIFIKIMEKKDYHYQFNWIEDYLALSFSFRTGWESWYRSDLENRFNQIMLQYFPESDDG